MKTNNDKQILKFEVEPNVHSDFKAEAAKRRKSMVNLFLEIFETYKIDNLKIKK